MNRMKLICTAALSVALLAVFAVYAAPASASIDTLFGTTVPTTKAANDPGAVTVGARFTTTAGGRITGIRFFKGSGNGGTHVVALYSSAGAQLAKATATGESATGWQTASFAGVSVPAGTYTAAVFDPQGHYPVQAPYSWPKTSGNLKGSAGVYRYGSALAYPTSTYNASNYFVDVNFSTIAGPIPSPSTSATSPTPTPTPTGSSTPPAAAGGFPNASTTGAKGTLQRVGPGGITSGPGWQYDPRGWVSAGNGAVLNSLDIPYNVDVVGSNVTIRNSRITQAGDSFGISLRHAANTLVTDTTITNGSGERLLVAVKDIYGDSTGTTLTRLDVSGTSTGVQMDAGTLQDSYIHDLLLKTGDHINGTTSNGGSTLLTIRHNTILNRYSQTDAVSLFQDFGGQANRVIENNLLAGGGYTIYGGEGANGATSNIKIRGNQISTRYYPNGGAFGPGAHFTATDPGNVFSGNTWADGPRTGQPVTI